MIGVSDSDVCYLNEIRSYLFGKVDDFVEVYYKSNNSVQLVFSLIYEAIHLKPYIKDIVEGEFKNHLRGKINDIELNRLKFLNNEFRPNDVIIELIK